MVMMRWSAPAHWISAIFLFPAGARRMGLWVSISEIATARASPSVTM